jgi:hypothetical protein
MKKSDLLIGFFMGIIASLLGSIGFLLIKFPKLLSVQGLMYIRDQGDIGKVITLGAIINILLFFLLLKKNKELMARGVILATIVLAIITVLLK